MVGYYDADEKQDVIQMPYYCRFAADSHQKREWWWEYVLDGVVCSLDERSLCYHATDRASSSVFPELVVPVITWEASYGGESVVPALKSTLALYELGHYDAEAAP